MATKKQTAKVGKVMHEYKMGGLHSGKGVAIAMSEAKMKPKKKK